MHIHSYVCMYLSGVFVLDLPFPYVYKFPSLAQFIQQITVGCQLNSNL